MRFYLVRGFFLAFVNYIISTLFLFDVNNIPFTDSSLLVGVHYIDVKLYGVRVYVENHHYVG